jgi:hypothetical protein
VAVRAEHVERKSRAAQVLVRAPRECRCRSTRQGAVHYTLPNTQPFFLNTRYLASNYISNVEVLPTLNFQTSAGSASYDQMSI